MTTEINSILDIDQHLKAIPMTSIIEWFAWNDRDWEYEDITYENALITAFEWFESIEEMGENRYRFLLETENN